MTKELSVMHSSALKDAWHPYRGLLTDISRISHYGNHSMPPDAGKIIPSGGPLLQKNT